MSFIDEGKIYSHENLRKCPICKESYLKYDFARCNNCSTLNCINCSILAGTQGVHCSSCFEKYSKDKKDLIGKEALRIKFWAKSGYYIFLGLILAAIIAFGLIYIETYFFYVGLIIVIISFTYGYKLFYFLNKCRPQMD